MRATFRETFIHNRKRVSFLETTFKKRKGYRPMKHLTPIIDICKYCNMHCRYCYAGSAFMSSPRRSELNKKFYSRIPLFYEFTDQVMQYNGNNPTSFILHGGEALLVNPENWRKI